VRRALADALDRITARVADWLDPPRRGREEARCPWCHGPMRDGDVHRHGGIEVAAAVDSAMPGTLVRPLPRG
jgi:hypothetical protein